MKKVICLCVLMITAWQVRSQQFYKQYEIVLQDTIETTQPGWIDLDNDGLLDLLLISKALSGKTHFQFIKGDTLTTPALHPKKRQVISANGFMFTDYDRDNKMDIVVSGEKNGVPSTAVYINQGAFEFDERIISVPAFSIARAADLDNDARPEWIVSGEQSGAYYLKILKQESDVAWKVVHDTLLISVAALEIVDTNYDGNLDVFVSGKLQGDTYAAEFLINQGGLYFKPGLATERLGRTTSGDFNGDGRFEVFLMGENKNGSLSSILYESAASGYNIKSYPITLRNAHPFSADFNSDGVIDVSYLGKTLSGDTLNIIQYGVQDFDTLVSKHLWSQHFGDAEHDGDLDLVQVIVGDELHLVFYENQPSKKNLAPGIPKKGVALSVFDRVFMYWEKPTDDHTVTPSLTFDVHLEGNAYFQVGDYDLLNEKRLTVSHGNNGTANFKLLKNVGAAGLNFSVQAVDNSLHAGALCIGGSSVCVSVDTESLSACSKEQFTLESPPDALWFSFSKGFLGMANEFVFQAEEQDTIFYYNPAKTGCSALKAWTIKINDDTLKTETSDRYSCKDADIQFSVETGWSNIKWSSQVRGDLGSTNTITYKVTQPDTVMVTMSNAQGCVLVRKTAVKISAPELQLTDDTYRILKGDEVQLSVSGASTYLWTPATGLNQADIPNPIASPSSSTQYTVTGYDSLGCTDQASVSIIVEGAGFIPNLFTPNDDGKNDQLKIYGMSAVKDFTFSIYNREGSVVYKTTDVTEAVQRGWDGTKSGTKQPPGVYFWKVKGEVSSGDRILLNGKDSGSIVLVR